MVELFWDTTCNPLHDLTIFVAAAQVVYFNVPHGLHSGGGFVAGGTVVLDQADGLGVEGVDVGQLLRRHGGLGGGKALPEGAAIIFPSSVC